MVGFRLQLALLSVCTLGAATAHAEGWRELFKDPQDGRFDGSAWLLDRRGFMPVPVVITEPAVGYGGGLALAFFHRREATTGNAQAGMAPPSVTGVMVAATENGTRIGGLGHLGIWRDNTVRYTGTLAAMDINLTFYGSADLPQVPGGVGYNMKGWGTFQQIIRKLGATQFWIGGQFIYLDADTALDQDNAAPIFDQLNGEVENFGAGLVMLYDTRDNIFTPSRGQQSEWYVRNHWGSFADDFEYTEVDGKNRWFLNPGQKWVIGLRLDASFTSGDTPFYALPFINQRGIPKSRYQGDVVLTTEVEARYNLDGRWFAIAFAGVGSAADSIDELDDEQARWAGGVGARYLIARMLGLQVGIDVA